MFHFFGERALTNRHIIKTNIVHSDFTSFLWPLEQKLILGVEMFYVGFQRSNRTIRSTFFKHHFTFEDFIVFSPVFCQLIAGFAYISSVFFISCEWKVYYFQLPKVFPATVAKVKHNLEKTLFWSVLGSSNLKTCIRTAFEGRFLK